MGRSGLLAAAATPDYKPMVVPPLPWRSCSEGGHLVLRSLVVRPPKQPGASMELKAALRAADARPPVGLSRVYAALNALGAVGWRINAPTLAAVEAVWAGGGGVAGLGTPGGAALALLPCVAVHLAQTAFDGGVIARGWV